MYCNFLCIASKDKDLYMNKGPTPMVERGLVSPTQHENEEEPDFL